MEQFILGNIDTGLKAFLVMCLIAVFAVVILTECIYMLFGKSQQEKKTKEANGQKTIYQRFPKEVKTWLPIFLSVFIFAFFSSFLKELNLNIPKIIIAGLIVGCVSTAFYNGGLKRILRVIEKRGSS